MIRIPHLGRSLALTLVVGLLAACGHEGATGITGMAVPTQAAAGRDVIGGNGSLKGGKRDVGAMTNGSWQQVFNASTCAPHGAIQGSGVFGPAGGVLTFGNSRLIIPGGALRDTVTISAAMPEGTSTSVEFAPHGLQFAKSAGLVISTTSCELADPLAPAVVYLSPEGLVLEYIPAIYDPHWKTIAAPIDHFSGYAIAF
ncbi:MAG: hypothetical protein ABIY52_12530 [Gemmatimonadaceae bacterium]